MKIRVVNFQGVSDATIVVDGFTLLLGPTHSGKSSFIRAILSALYLSVPSDYVKFGATKAEVTLDMAEHKWEWSKGCVGSRDGSHQITLDGVLHDKIGRTIPTSLLQHVGFAPQQIDSSVFFPQFQKQLSSLFALGDDVSSSVLFNLILSFSSYDRLPDMRKAVHSDLKEAMSVKQDKEAILTHSATKWELVSSANSKYEEALRLRSEASAMIAKADYHSELIRISNKIRGKKSAICRIANMHDPLRWLSGYVTSAKLTYSMQSSKRYLAALSSVNIDCSIYDKVLEIADSVRAVSIVTSLQRDLLNRKTNYSRFLSIQSLETVSEADEILNRISSVIKSAYMSSDMEDRRRKLLHVNTAISNVNLSDISNKVTSILAESSKISTFLSLLNRLRAGKNVLRDLDKSSSSTSAEISSVTGRLNEFTVCPLCKSSLRGDMTLNMSKELPTVAEIESLQRAISSLQQQYAVIMERKRLEESVIAGLEEQVRKHGFRDSDALAEYVMTETPKVRQEYDKLVLDVNAAITALNQVSAI
jgi:DNA repair exonuclease SbcCD ATPase subunit